VKAATTVLPTDVVTPEAHAMLTTEHSDGSRGVYAAAIRSYLTILGRSRDLTSVNGLANVFGRDALETVIVQWIADHKTGRPGALSPRTMFRYADVIRLTLLRMGEGESASALGILCKKFPILQEGKAANEFMSAETEAWCRNLLADEDRMRIFETQHVLYVITAKEALDAAEAEGLDLVELSDPEKMKRLPDKNRRRAKALLRRARKFGTCAAAAAIELEGAPFRRANLLGLMRSGPLQTFFDDADAKVPHFRILIPNELLKNGDALTRRGEAMAPVHIAKMSAGDYGPGILRFFLDRIRPLFPGAASSHALFAAIEPRHDHLVEKTFDTWLVDCSCKIGMPMTAHNYRHGVASIQINEDPNCLEELAILLCDKPETLRKYYAFLDREKTLRKKYSPPGLSAGRDTAASASTRRRSADVAPSSPRQASLAILPRETRTRRPDDTSAPRRRRFLRVRGQAWSRRPETRGSCLVGERRLGDRSSRASGLPRGSDEDLRP